MRRNLLLAVTFLVVIAGGGCLALVVGGPIGALGGLLALLALLLLAGGFSGYNRKIDRAGRTGRPTDYDLGGDLERPPSGRDLL